MRRFEDFFSQPSYLEGCPPAVALELRVLLFALPSVHAGVGGTLAHTPQPDPVEFLLGLAHQVDHDTVEDKGPHATHEPVRQITLGTNVKVVVQEHGSDRASWFLHLKKIQ